MAATQRAKRLRIDIRLAILENFKALSRQLDVALKENDIDSAKQIQTNISALHDQLDELSRLSLDALEDSDEVKQTITQLRQSVVDLKDDADTITDLANALKIGAQIVQKATEIVSTLEGITH